METTAENEEKSGNAEIIENAINEAVEKIEAAEQAAELAETIADQQQAIESLKNQNELQNWTEQDQWQAIQNLQQQQTAIADQLTALTESQQTTNSELLAALTALTRPEPETPVIILPNEDAAAPAVAPNLEPEPEPAAEPEKQTTKRKWF